jgi:putative ABC transport system substrate-binding protein
MTPRWLPLVSILTLGLLASPTGVEAQTPAKVARLGTLTLGSPPPPVQDRIVQPLGNLGWVEGRNLAVVRRDAYAQLDRLPALAAELIAEGVGVIVAVGMRPIVAARQVTTTVPIVMVMGAAPVELGIVKSLARPGTNVTGAALQSPEMNGKLVELLRDTVPGARRIALLTNPDYPGMPPFTRAAEDAARSLGITPHSVEVRTPAQLPQALDRIRAAKPDGLLILPDTVIYDGRRAILDFAARERLPIMDNFRPFAGDEGLMSYSPNIPDQYRVAVRFVDRILRGARPGDLPVEQPTKYDLVVNLKTARTLGLVIPPAVLARADETIGP